MTCSVCGCLTLSDGVCIDCSNKRFDDYPRLKAMETRLRKRLEFVKKMSEDTSNIYRHDYDVELSNLYSILNEQPTIEVMNQ